MNTSVIKSEFGGIALHMINLFVPTKYAFHISNTTVSSVASSPEQVCLRQNSTHNYCKVQSNNTSRNIRVFPGQEFAFKVALVDQFNGLVKGACS